MKSTNDVTIEMTADWNDNTERDRYYDLERRHVITRNCVGHVTRSRLLTGLLASVCLTLCSLLTNCVSVTSSGEHGCHGEVTVIGQVVINDIGTVQQTSVRYVKCGSTDLTVQFISMRYDIFHVVLYQWLYSGCSVGRVCIMYNIILIR